MFKCAITKQFSRPGEKPYRLIVEKRTKEYTAHLKGDAEPTVVGRGWEIVKEVNVTLEGLRRWIVDNPSDEQSKEAYQKLLRSKEREIKER